MIWPPLLQKIAIWCNQVTLEQIPESVKQVARTALTDYVAVTIAGSKMPVAKHLQKFAQMRAPMGSCQILGQRQTTSMAYAAYANGVASHALDFDDVSWATIGHPTVTVAPTAFAAAEQASRGGSDILLAYITAVEAQHQIARWVMPSLSEQGWHTTPAIGVFGATIAAAKILHLDEKQLCHALAIAASSASGVRGNFGSMAKATHAGMAAFNGVNAVELALLGVTGKFDVLESDDGFAQCFANVTLNSSAPFTLGQQWDLLSPGLVFKQYPCCSGSHPAIDCLSDLITQYQTQHTDIEGIHVGASLLGPRELVCKHPKNAIEAKFSMQYALAARLVYGQVGLKQFTDQSVLNPQIQALMEKIKMSVDPDLAKLGFIGTAPIKLTLMLKNGQVIKSENDLAKGNPEKPLSEQDIKAKFYECAEPIVGKSACHNWLENLHTFESCTITQLKKLVSIH